MLTGSATNNAATTIPNGRLNCWIHYVRPTVQQAAERSSFWVFTTKAPPPCRAIPRKYQQ